MSELADEIIYINFKKSVNKHYSIPAEWKGEKIMLVRQSAISHNMLMFAAFGRR